MSEETDEAKIADFFSRLNLDYAGLERVRDALTRGDYSAAEEAYLAFRREREQPNLEFRYSWGNFAESFAECSSAWDFVTEDFSREFPDHRVTWRDRERIQPFISREPGYTWSRTQGFKRSPYTLLDLANFILQHRIFSPGAPELGVQDLGPEWDWTHVPENGNRVWTHGFNYQLFQRVLAQAYWLTGEEHYIAKLIDIAKDYVRYVDGKPEWIWFPPLQIVRQYTTLMPYILSWEKLKGHDFCLMLSLYCGRCIEGMIGFVERDPPPQGNQLFFGGLGLLMAGVAFPDCRQSQVWRERGLKVIGDYFGEGASYPDGTSKENSAGYVVGAAHAALSALHLAEANGLPFPEAYVARMVQRADYLAYSSKPDGSFVWNGDSRRLSSLGYLRSINRREGRADLNYITSFGAQGSPPQATSFWYPYCGHGIMRSRWGRDANYLQFDVGPVGTLHGHENALAVEVVAYGRSLVEDLGVHSYSSAPDDARIQQFVKETSGHNTVVVDGKCQVRLLKGPYESREPLPNHWHSTPACDFLEGTYGEGYAHHRVDFSESGVPRRVILGEVDDSIYHSRSVLFVKSQRAGDPEYWLITDFLAGSGDHSFEQLFHLTPVKVDPDPAKKVVRSTTPGEPNLAFVPGNAAKVALAVVEGQMEPVVQGWHAGGGGLSVAPAPCVIYRVQGAAPQIIQTVLWPLRAHEATLPVIVATREERDVVWTEIGLPDGRRDLCAVANKTGRHEYESSGFEGRALLERREGERVLLREVVNRGQN